MPKPVLSERAADLAAEFPDVFQCKIPYAPGWFGLVRRAAKNARKHHVEIYSFGVGRGYLYYKSTLCPTWRYFEKLSKIIYDSQVTCEVCGEKGGVSRAENENRVLCWLHVYPYNGANFDDILIAHYTDSNMEFRMEVVSNYGK